MEWHVHIFKNETLQDYHKIDSPDLQDLLKSELLRPLYENKIETLELSIKSYRFLAKLFLKNTETEVFRSSEGVFFYFNHDGEEESFPMPPGAQSLEEYELHIKDHVDRLEVEIKAS